MKQQGSKADKILAAMDHVLKERSRLPQDSQAYHWLTARYQQLKSEWQAARYPVARGIIDQINGCGQ